MHGGALIDARWRPGVCTLTVLIFDLKHELRVRWNHTGHPFVAVRQVWTDTKPATTTDAHPSTPQESPAIVLRSPTANVTTSSAWKASPRLR